MPISSSGASSRSCILQVGVCAGKLCAVANTLTATKNETSVDGLSVADLETEDAMVLAMTELMMSLWETSVSLDINLVVAVREKLELNKRKYHVHLCKVRCVFINKNPRIQITTGIHAVIHVCRGNAYTCF